MTKQTKDEKDAEDKQNSIREMIVDYMYNKNWASVKKLYKYIQPKLIHVTEFEIQQTVDQMIKDGDVKLHNHFRKDAQYCLEWEAKAAYQAILDKEMEPETAEWEEENPPSQ